MRCSYDFSNGEPPLTSLLDFFPLRWDWQHLYLFATGLPFSLTLISILLADKLGRYTARRHFGIELHIPAIFTSSVRLGESGMVNQADSRVRSRSALIAISAAGPVAGFAVSAATTCYGLLHSTVIGAQAQQPLIRLSAPCVIGLLRSTLLASFPDIPPTFQMLPHPVLVASWIGLLITAVKLIPAGRSYGGQIVYAISPRLHKATTTIAIAALLYFGTVEWIGWLLGAAILITPSMRLPRLAGPAPLSLEWLTLAPVCAAIFLLTIPTQPIVGMNLVQVLLRIHWGLAVR